LQKWKKEVYKQPFFLPVPSGWPLSPAAEPFRRRFLVIALPIHSGWQGETLQGAWFPFPISHLRVDLVDTLL